MLKPLTSIIFFAVLSVISCPAYADVTYTYTGNPFTDAYGSYSGDRVTGTISFSSLAPLLSFQDVTPFVTGFSLSDGAQNISSSSVNTSVVWPDFFGIQTDAQANITAWSFQVYADGSQPGTTDFIQTQAISAPYYDGGGIFDSNAELASADVINSPGSLLLSGAPHDMFVSNFAALASGYIAPTSSTFGQAYIASQATELSTAQVAFSEGETAGTATFNDYVELGYDGLNILSAFEAAAAGVEDVLHPILVPTECLSQIWTCEGSNVQGTISISNDKMVTASSYDVFDYNLPVNVDSNYLSFFNVGDRYIVDSSILGDFGGLPAFSVIDVSSISGDTMNLYIENMSEVPAVPEPPMYQLMLAGLMVVGGLNCKRICCANGADCVA